MNSSGISGWDQQPVIDTRVAHSARVWNYMLGGKDNYPVDHEAAEQFIATLPSCLDVARASRGFLVRAVRYLAGEVEIRQFLDIGTGLPTANNTHEVAQASAPECRVVYVDNDPLVLAYARALLSGGAHPVLLNDDIIVPALAENSGAPIPLAAARNYACDGCFENTTGTPNAA